MNYLIPVRTPVNAGPVHGPLSSSIKQDWACPYSVLFSTSWNKFVEVNFTLQKKHFGFQTGDLVRAVVPRGKYTGTWVNRVVVRANGVFDIVTTLGKVSINQQYCTRLFAADGYQYA